MAEFSIHVAIVRVDDWAERDWNPTSDDRVVRGQFPADGAEPLGAVLDRAVTALLTRPRTGRQGHSFKEHLIGFVRAGSPEDANPALADREQVYGVRADGRLVVGETYSVRHISVDDLRRAAADGYMQGSWDHIVLWEPEGLGGGSADVHTLLAFLAGLGVTTFTDAITDAVRAAPAALQRQRDREVREFAEAWAEQRICDRWVLLDWLVRKPAWTTDEVSRRLGLPEEGARQLLIAIGMEENPRNALWAPGSSNAARGRRQRFERGPT